ncbi:MAG TPA: hypothetical protein VM097_08960 [Mycobacteriales bacterium]|nr:hypothetical protein [Mycobacteriales bacterium]
MTVFAASLRVYEPLAAFEGAERDHWEQYVRAGAQLPAPAATALEQAAVTAAMVHRRLPLLADHAHVLDVDGVTLVSPWRTALRAQEALVDFAGELPEVVVDAFTSRTVLESAEVELDRWRAEHGTVTPHVRTSAWQVPLRWFLLVDPQERQVSLGEPVEVTVRRTGRSLVYRTPMSRARRRVARALSVLRVAVQDEGVTQGVEELGRWLEEFHPRSLVELDYGGLVHLLDDAELSQDESARDMAHAMERLAAGDGEGAAVAYQRMTARMKALQAVETAN